MKTIKVVKSRTPEHVEVHIDDLAEYQTDFMCKALITNIKKMFDDPAVQEDYKRWKEERRQKKAEYISDVARQTK